MSISEVLSQLGGSGEIAKSLNLSTQDVEGGANVLVPVLLDKIKAQMSGSNGMLGSLLGKASELGLVNKAMASLTDSQSAGNKILENVLGSPAASREVAENAAQQSGINADSLKKLLPVLALAVTSFLNKNNNQGGSSLASGLAAGVGKLFK